VLSSSCRSLSLKRAACVRAKAHAQERAIPRAPSFLCVCSPRSHSPCRPTNRSRSSSEVTREASLVVALAWQAAFSLDVLEVVSGCGSAFAATDRSPHRVVCANCTRRRRALQCNTAQRSRAFVTRPKTPSSQVQCTSVCSVHKTRQTLPAAAQKYHEPFNCPLSEPYGRQRAAASAWHARIAAAIVAARGSRRLCRRQWA
jgi:hypothetical protein